jgi:hypothetical protein
MHCAAGLQQVKLGNGGSPATPPQIAPSTAHFGDGDGDGDLDGGGMGRGDGDCEGALDGGATEGVWGRGDGEFDANRGTQYLPACHPCTAMHVAPGLQQLRVVPEVDPRAPAHLHQRPAHTCRTILDTRGEGIEDGDTWS